LQHGQWLSGALNQHHCSLQHGHYRFQALLSNTTGSANTATGVSALGLNTTASHNTATGFEALGFNTSALNTAFGSKALHLNTTGSENTAVGYEALSNSSTGARNIAVGKWAGVGVSTASDVICIGAQGENGDNSCYIGQIFNRTVSGGTVVFINSAGKLGTVTSSRRFKEDIKPMNDSSGALFSLKPVTFRYKKEIDPQCIPQFGLIAEDVAEVNPELVVRDKEGKVNTVRYEQINAMLLNEFLKEHKTVKELKSEVTTQETTISSLKKEIGLLTAQLKEQSAQIEKVSAQVTTSEAAPRGVTKR
jgi:trimeric autotransporter adhesin